MADYSITGYVFWGPEGIPLVGKGTYNGRYYSYARASQIQGSSIYYQGFFHSGDLFTTLSQWSPVYTTGDNGEIDCNLGDEDWLDTDSIPTGSTVVFVFWEKVAGNDRTAPEVLHGVRGWLETDPLTGSTQEIMPVLAFTSIVYTYSDDMPDRYGTLFRTYNFDYSSVLHETYDIDRFWWSLNYYPYTRHYTDKSITMSHESVKYAEDMFATVDSIKEILTFSNGDYIERTQSPTTTNFTHEFDDFNSSKLIRTVEYEVGGVFYEDTLYPNRVWQDQIIATYFASLAIKTPGNYDIDIYRYRDFKLKINTDRVDFWDFEAQIKEGDGSILANFNINIDRDNDYLELTLDSETTASLLNDKTINASSVNSSKKLLWDLRIITPTDRVFNIIEGNCYVHRVITRTT